jgi:hypothetical protein
LKGGFNVIHPKKTYYPEYDVLSEWEEWDKTTQSVIQSRLSHTKIEFFTEEEQHLLLSLIPILFPSHLGDVSTNILSLFDNRCLRMKGFSKGSCVKKVDIIRIGINSIMNHSYAENSRPFSDLEEEKKLQFVENLQKNIGYKNCWQQVQPYLFFQTIMDELIPIVYSDPSIWSKIGYGGPAYPRGYYAFGPSQFDKWEAKMHD